MKKEKPMIIAQIMGKWIGGGVEAVVMNYYRHIDRNKIQFDFICDEDSTNIPYDEIEKLGGRVIIVPPYQHIFAYLKKLKQIFKENKYKIVHSHINALSVFPLYAAKCAGVPVRIAHSHSTSNKKEWKKTLMKNMLRPFSKVFATDYMCCSELAGRWLFGNKTYDEGKVYLLNNAIDVEKFAYNEDVRKAKRKELEIADDTFVIGHIGRFVAQKNHTFLIDIFNEVHKEKENSILLLVGQGPLENEIKEKVNRLGLSDSVKFLGQRDDVSELYQVMDLLLFPSLYEGLGMVVVEAQVSGLSCIVSTAIPKNANINDRITFMDLENKLRKWTEKVIGNLNKFNRNKIQFNDNIKEYNIKEEIKRIEKFYLKRIEKHIIRVLQIGMTDNLGGIESYLINYYRNIDKNKIQFDFINIYSNKLCFQDEMKEMGAQIYNVPNYYKHPLRYIKSVRYIINKYNYQIVHCNMNSAAMIFPLIASKLSCAKIIIAHAHNNSSDKGILKAFLHSVNKNFIPLLANEFFACSIEAAQWFFSKKIIKGTHFSIIENGIDPSKFMYDSKIREDVRNELNISRDTFVIGHVGRFVKQKNHNFLIEVFKEILELESNSLLILIGVGELQGKIKQKVDQIGIQKKVLFLNNRNDVNRIMQAMDVFVLPSLYEGLGIVLVEAQYLGLPIVASDKIPEVAKVSDNFKMISLAEEKSNWADCILKMRNMKRKENYIKQYNIHQCTDVLIKKYIERLREVDNKKRY